MIDGEHRLTPTGEQVRGELTLPVHMSLLDIAAPAEPRRRRRPCARPPRRSGPQPGAARAGRGRGPEPEPEDDEDDDDNGYHTVVGASAPAAAEAEPSRARRSSRARPPQTPTPPSRRRCTPATRSPREPPPSPAHRAGDTADRRRRPRRPPAARRTRPRRRGAAAVVAGRPPRRRRRRPSAPRSAAPAPAAPPAAAPPRRRRPAAAPAAAPPGASRAARLAPDAAPRAPPPSAPPAPPPPVAPEPAAPVAPAPRRRSARGRAAAASRRAPAPASAPRRVVGCAAAGRVGAARVAAAGGRAAPRRRAAGRRRPRSPRRPRSRRTGRARRPRRPPRRRRPPPLVAPRPVGAGAAPRRAAAAPPVPRPIPPPQRRRPAFVEAWAIRAAAEAAGLRLPTASTRTSRPRSTPASTCAHRRARGRARRRSRSRSRAPRRRPGSAHGATVVTGAPGARSCWSTPRARGRWVIADELDQADAGRGAQAALDAARRRPGDARRRGGRARRRAGGSSRPGTARRRAGRACCGASPRRRRRARPRTSCARSCAQQDRAGDARRVETLLALAECRSARACCLEAAAMPRPPGRRADRRGDARARGDRRLHPPPDRACDAPTSRPRNGPRSQRAKATLDQLGFYPEPVNIDHVRILHVPWLFRLPWFRRFHGYEMGPLILLKFPLAQVSPSLIAHELCHVWQDQDHRLQDVVELRPRRLRRTTPTKSKRATRAPPPRDRHGPGRAHRPRPPQRGDRDHARVPASLAAPAAWCCSSTRPTARTRCSSRPPTGARDHRGRHVAFIPADAAVPRRRRSRCREIRPTPGHRRSTSTSTRASSPRRSARSTTSRRSRSRSRSAFGGLTVATAEFPTRDPEPADHVRRPRGRARRAAGRRRPVRAVNLRPEQPRGLRRDPRAPARGVRASALEADIADALRAANDHVPDLCLVATRRRRRSSAT